jgi:hypothetical protein
VTDDDLSKRLGVFVIAKGFYDLLKWKHAINNRFQAVDGNGAVHGDELRPIASEDDAERGVSIFEVASDNRP